MDPRERRLGENEALFRHVNERIREIGEGFSLVATHTDFVCECADPKCTEKISMTLEEYEAVRAEGDLFVIRDGHDVPDVESIVETTEGYAVVRKHPGDPAELAEELDPRSD